MEKREENIISKKRCIVVLGMHRSGTSLISGILNILGIYFGKIARNAPSKERKGYLEHRSLSRTNQYVLETHHISWDYAGKLSRKFFNDTRVQKLKEKIKRIITTDFSEYETFGFKDPRVCRLMPLWFQIFRELNIEPFFVFIFRNPFEVALSLEQRDNMEEEKALRLWGVYNRDAEIYTKTQKRILINYKDLIENPVEQIERIAKFIGLDDIEDKKDELIKFVSVDLKHHHEEKVNTRYMRLRKEIENEIQESSQGIILGDMQESSDSEPTSE